jgi:CRISPR system Cascade subunit CasB
MPDPSHIPQSADDLVREVTRIAAQNPADRSVLRHALGKPPEEVALGVHRIVVPFLPGRPRGRKKAGRYEAAERAYYAVAALIASQPRSARDEAGADQTPGSRSDGETAPDPTDSASVLQRHWSNLGYSLAHAVELGGNEKSLENHLQLLMRQDADGLYRHLPRLVLRLRGDQVHIDWGVLIYDLTRWARNPRLVAKEWAQSYYRERLTADRTKNKAKSDNGNNPEESLA